MMEVAHQNRNFIKSVSLYSELIKQTQKPHGPNVTRTSIAKLLAYKQRRCNASRISDAKLFAGKEILSKEILSYN